MKHVIAFVICAALYAYKVSAGSATCTFPNGKGEVKFLERNGELRANVMLHRVADTESSEFKIHVHENEPTSGETCEGVGGHFDPTSDAGDIEPEHGFGSFRVHHGHLHTGFYTIPALSLSGTQNGILGRSVALHGAGGGKIGCCKIE